jgi:tetratricopeptide (TPR) repeat protein
LYRAVKTGALLALLACCATACVGPRLSQCPANGGQPWHELESNHFLLKTDLQPQEAHEAVAYLERTRAAMLAAIWPGALKLEMPKLTVHVLAESSQYWDIFPSWVDGFFSRGSDEPLIVLHGSPSSWDKRFTEQSETTSSTVRHELAHHLSSYLLPRQPRWLAEGLAQFLETIQISKDGRTAVLGRPHLHAATLINALLEGMERGRVKDFSMRDVIIWKKASEDTPGWKLASRYSASWLLVHWLYNTRTQQLAQLLALLAKGEDPLRATQAVLPELYSPTLNQTLLGHMRKGSYQEITVRVPLEALAITERTLGDAEVHTLRMRLLLLAAPMAKQGAEAWLQLARRELEEALRQDPKSLLALKQKVAEAPEEQRLPLARAVVEAHPHEAGAWLVLAVALKRDTAAQAEQEEAFKKAVELAPRNVGAATGLALLYVTQRRYEEALPLAQHAATLAPWNPLVLGTYGLALTGLGRCPEAFFTYQRTLDLLEEHSDVELAKKLRALLQAFPRSSCAQLAL